MLLNLICSVGFIWTIIMGVKCVADLEKNVGTYEELEVNNSFVYAMLLGGLFGTIVVSGSSLMSLLVFPLMMAVWFIILAFIYFYFI